MNYENKKKAIEKLLKISGAYYAPDVRAVFDACYDAGYCAGYDAYLQKQLEELKKKLEGGK